MVYLGYYRIMNLLHASEITYKIFEQNITEYVEKDLFDWTIELITEDIKEGHSGKNQLTNKLQNLALECYKNDARSIQVDCFT